MTAQAIAGSRSPGLREAMRALRVAAGWARLVEGLPAGQEALRGCCGALAEERKRRALLRAVAI